MRGFQIAWITTAAVLSISVAHAGQKQPKSPVIHVQSLDPDFDPSSLKAPGIVVHPASELEVKDTVPPPKERDAIFREAGISESVSKLDALDRDLLYDRARRLKLGELEKKYPKMDKGRLAKLQKLIHRTKK